MMAEHKRWYDLEPTVSLAISLLRNANNQLRLECAEFIISYAKDFGITLPTDIFANFNFVLKRWYDEEKLLSEALEYIRIAPDEFKREISYKIIEFLETQEISNV